MAGLAVMVQNYAQEKQSRASSLLSMADISLPIEKRVLSPVHSSVHCSSVFHSHHLLTANTMVTSSSYNYRCQNCKNIEAITDDFHKHTPTICKFSSMNQKYLYQKETYPLPPLITFNSSNLKVKVALDELLMHTYLSDLLGNSSTHLSTFYCGKDAYTLSSEGYVDAKKVAENLDRIKALLTELNQKYKLTFYGLHWMDFSFCASSLAPKEEKEKKEGEKEKKEAEEKKEEIRFNNLRHCSFSVQDNLKVYPYIVKMPIFPLTRHISTNEISGKEGKENGGWIPAYLMLLLTLYVANVIESKVLEEY